jgi:ABC-type transporter Mla subunit MlaD
MPNRRTAEAVFFLALGVVVLAFTGYILTHLPQFIGFLGSGL